MRWMEDSSPSGSCSGSAACTRQRQWQRPCECCVPRSSSSARTSRLRPGLLPIEGEQAGDDPVLRGSGLEAVSLKHRLVIGLVGLLKLRRHEERIVEIGKRASGGELPGFEDLLRGRGRSMSRRSPGRQVSALRPQASFALQIQSSGCCLAIRLPARLPLPWRSRKPPASAPPGARRPCGRGRA